MSDYQQRAEEWKKSQNLNGGLVVFCKGNIVGWMQQLANPDGWQPGCLAINDDGQTWMSEGQSPKYPVGSKQWRSVS